MGKTYILPEAKGNPTVLTIPATDEDDKAVLTRGSLEAVELSEDQYKRAKAVLDYRGGKLEEVGEDGDATVKIHTHAQADAAAKEAGVEFPDSVVTVDQKVDYLQAHQD